MKKLAHTVRDAVVRISSRLLEGRPASRTRSITRTQQFVLEKYDRLAGEKIDKYKERMSGAAPEAPVVRNHRHLVAPQGEVLAMRHDHVAHNILRPLLKPDARVLEVGAGEMTTLVPLALRLEDLGLLFSAVELSWSRIAMGREFATESGITLEYALAGDALGLPFPNDSFDLVYTSHCLEQIPLGLEQAAKELLRVSRGWVACMEPSYELGHPQQRQRMKYKHYATRLDQVFRSLGYGLERHELIPHDLSPDNRSALYLTHTCETDTHAVQDPSPTCPRCIVVLQDLSDVMFCPKCHNAYPVLEGIPCLCPEHGVLASRLEDIHSLRLRRKEAT